MDRSGPSPRLVVNAKEAARVREIFKLYLAKESLLHVANELRHRGWPNKKRVTKKGKTLGGRPFDKATLYVLLTNPIFVGKISHKGVLYDGEHEPIVEQDVFDRVQSILKYNGRTGGVEVRNKYGATLRGLLRCKCCGHSMIIWRKRPGGDEPEGIEQDNAVLDAWFRTQGYSTTDSEFDIVWVNGDNNLANLRQDDTPDDGLGETGWKVRIIEQDFHRLMFDTSDVPGGA